MTELLVILPMALLWAFLQGEINTFNLIIGALMALALLSVLQRDDKNNFAKRVLGVLKFVAIFFKELFIANILLARLAFETRPRLQPHVIVVPLKLESDIAISLLSATITLLPGTVAMGVSEDRSEIYAHAMGASLDEAKDSIIRMEKLILGFMT